MPRNQTDSNVNMPQTFIQDSDEEDSIDLGELFGVLWHHIVLLLIVALACGAAGYSIARFVIPEQFESTTEIYILNKSDSGNDSVNYSDLQVGTQLTKDYAELITSRNVLEKVIADLQLPYDYEELESKIEVTTPTDTRIVSITVTDTDPEMAQRIANEVRVDASDQIKSVMEIDAVNVVEEANLPTEKSAPSNSRWAIIAALIGFLVVAVILVIQFVLDDSIKTSEDVERYLGLSTLALIPLDNSVLENSVEQQNKKRGRGKKSKRNSRDHEQQGHRHTESAEQDISGSLTEEPEERASRRGRAEGLEDRPSRSGRAEGLEERASRSSHAEAPEERPSYSTRAENAEESTSGTRAADTPDKRDTRSSRREMTGAERRRMAAYRSGMQKRTTSGETGAARGNSHRVQTTPQRAGGTDDDLDLSTAEDWSADDV